MDTPPAPSPVVVSCHGFVTLLLLFAALMLNGCATDGDYSQMTPYERDRAVLGQFLDLSPQANTRVEYLSFPPDGRGGAYAVQDREFSQLRRDLSRIERLNLSTASPEVREHIRATTSFWRQVDAEQPRLRSVAHTVDANTRSATQAGAQIGADISRGDPISAGAGAVLGQMVARAPMERMFEDHRRYYGGRLISLMVEENNLAQRYGLRVPPVLSQNLRQMQGGY